MRSGNPVLKPKAFNETLAGANEEKMTLMGTVHKTSVLLVLLICAASFTWKMGADDPAIMTWSIGGFIVGLIFAIVTVFKPTWAPTTAPVYAVAEAFGLGGISLLFETMYPGIVLQAVMLTFGVLFALLGAYRSGLIQATENFKLGVAAATGGIFLVYMVNIIMGFFGASIPFIHESGPLGIAFSGFVVVIAALNLVMDFDFIETGAEQGSAKYMEWFGAFGLIVTLVWLYIEILHLLSKLRGRD